MTQSGQPIVFVGDDPALPRELEPAFDVVVRRERTAIVEYVESTAVGCVVVDGTGDERVATVATVRDAAPSVPIIYVTATPDGSAAAAATRAGATEYFARSDDERLADRVAAVSVDQGAVTSNPAVPSPGAVDVDANRRKPGSTRPEPDDRIGRTGSAGTADGVPDHHRHLDVVTELLETTRALFSCDSRTDVATVVVDAAERVLGFDVVTVRLHDPETDELELTAASDAISDLFDERPRVDVDETEMGDAFRESDPIVYEDVRTSSVGSRYDDSFRAAMCIPIDDHGLLNVGSPISGAFDDHHVQLAQLLTASAAAALERADRREDLLRHEQVLETVEGMVYALDEDARFTVVTDPLADRLGYDREELLGEHVSLVFGDQEYERAESHIRNLLADPQRDSGAFEAAYTTADGERFPVEIECSLLPRGDDGSYRGSVSVVRDITQRKEREQYLQVLNRVLRHNLRNDLTVVIGYAELLCDQLDDRDLATAADTLRQTASDLARTSEKTRAIQYALDRDSDLQPTDVTAVVEETIDEIEIKDAAISLSSDGSCRAWADPGLRLVVENLLENAIRHAGLAPTIEVGVTREDDWVRLAVTDDGPGIPPAEIDVVTGETDITQLTHSSGLGLWLVRWIVDSYGGSVSFSRPPGGGSRVEISLEAAPAASTDAQSASIDEA